MRGSHCSQKQSRRGLPHLDRHEIRCLPACVYGLPFRCVVFYVFMARFLLEKHTRGQNICSPVHKPVQPYRADCPHWRVGTAPGLCQIDACTAHDCRTEAIAVPPTRQAMRFPVIDFVAAGKFGASSKTWRPTAFCTAIRRQSREKRFTLSTGNRAQNRRDPRKTLYTSDIEYFLHFGETESVRKPNGAMK